MWRRVVFVADADLAWAVMVPERHDDGPLARSLARLRAWQGDWVRWRWRRTVAAGAVRPGSRTAAGFGSFGAGSLICFPTSTTVSPQTIYIGADTLIGPDCTLSGKWFIPHTDRSRALVIGDRCVIGRGNTLVAMSSVTIGDDVWTGHHCRVGDQNHEYIDVTMPIGPQTRAPEPVEIGAGTWLGHHVIVLPGVTIGEHVVVAAGSVVAHDLPSFTVCAGVPARVIRRYAAEEGWVRVGPEQATTHAARFAAT